MADIGEAWFLRDLSPRELDKVKAATGRKRFAAEDAIVQVGEKVGSLYVIDTGAVRVVVPVEGQHGREEQVLADLAAGDCFGEFSFVDRKPASASVYASEATHLFAIPYRELDRLIEQDPYLARTLLKSLLATIVGRFRRTDATLALARYVIQYV